MKTETYIAQKKRLPETGKQIIGSFDNNTIIVYQAFNHHIAEYAVKHQSFGGPHYSFNRMSWIKPGFLWMMHRAGWAAKEQQQHILAISLPIIHFKTILKQATISSYDATLFTSHYEWKKELDRTEVRLQWDPDHDPYGSQEERKAIQIGMKRDILRQFCTEWITGIEDITGFVKSEHEKVLNHVIDDLNIPYEEVLELNDTIIEKRIGITRIE
jgi:Domain of unknown function (DUF4291)